MRKVRGGFTIPEILVAAGLLGLLSAICFTIYAMGLQSWTKVDAKTEVMSLLQALQKRVASDVQSSQLPSVSVPADNSGVAFLTAGPESERQVDGGGRLLWQNFAFYYHDSPNFQVFRRDEAYAPADRSLLTTLDVYSGQPLVDFKSGGQLVSRDIHVFQVALQSPDMLQLTLRAKIGKEQMDLNSNFQLQPAP